MQKFAALAAALVVAGCAGRAPQPIAIAQPQDRFMNCTAITAEIDANNVKVQALAQEQGFKVAQNVAAGVAGLFIPVLWFGMDFQGAASTDAAALQARQQYLASLAVERCPAGPAPAPIRTK